MTSHESDYAYTSEPEDPVQDLEFIPDEQEKTDFVDESDVSPEALAKIQELQAEVEALEQKMARIDETIDEHLNTLSPIADKVRGFHFQIEDIKTNAKYHSPYKLTGSDKEHIAKLTTKMAMEVSRYRREKEQIENVQLVPLRRERFIAVEQRADLLRQIMQLRQAK
jgi:uncharacterized protein YoxC